MSTYLHKYPIIHSSFSVLIVGFTALIAVPLNAAFIQPVNLTWSGTSTLNSPAVLVGDVASETDVHPDPVSGGGGTSWYASNWNGHSLAFDFDMASKLTSFHLWDYYLHTNNVLQLTLYDSAGGSGNILYDVQHTIVPGPSGGGSKRHDIALGAAIPGVLSGRIRPISEINDSYPGFGLAEIGFVAVPEPATLVLAGLAIVGIMGMARRRK